MGSLQDAAGWEAVSSPQSRVETSSYFSWPSSVGTQCFRWGQECASTGGAAFVARGWTVFAPTRFAVHRVSIRHQEAASWGLLSGKKIPTLLSELERMRRFEYETHLSVRAPTILSGTSRCCFHLEQVHCCFLDVSLLAACSSLFFPG